MPEDALDPDDFYADYEARARARRERRLHRRRRGFQIGEVRHLWETRAGRVLVGTVAALAMATVVGLIALWPHGAHAPGQSQAFGGPTLPATVQAVRDSRCPGPTPQRCRQIVITVGGRSSTITLGPTNAAPSVAAGDDVRVSAVSPPRGVPRPRGFEPYSFVDVDRHGALRTLIVVLLVVAVGVLWWRGVLAVVGVALSLLLLTTFVVPAILAGRPALAVALVGSLAVMFVTVLLTSGLTAQTLTAALGISMTLGLTALLALVGLHTVQLDGHSSELSVVLSQQNQGVSLRGVVLAGMVIGALGVLADTAVTQASAVAALRKANPRLSPRGLYRRAFAVGRDHLSATIHTLVLAYAGTALPLLLVMRSSNVATGDALNVQDVAEPVVATAVGCIALAVAVPVTTALAAAFATRVPVDALADGHGHAH